MSTTPIKQRRRRQPGEYLRNKFEEFALWPVFLFTLSGCFFIASAMVWSDILLSRRSAPFILPFFAIATLIHGLIAHRRVPIAAHAVIQGYKGEVAVAEALDQLRPIGYEPFHDLPTGRGNIDHILVGPAGIFVIETKAISKPDSGRPTIDYDGKQIRILGQPPIRDPIPQALAAAAETRTRLKAQTNLSPTIRPVILYPGWYVNSASGADVWVLNPGMLKAWLETEARRRGTLNPNDLALLRNRLDLWSRESTPS